MINCLLTCLKKFELVTLMMMCTHESDENYSNVLLRYIQNKSAMKRNETVLKDLTGELYTEEANETLSDSYKYPLATTQDV